MTQNWRIEEPIRLLSGTQTRILIALIAKEKTFSSEIFMSSFSIKNNHLIEDKLV